MSGHFISPSKTIMHGFNINSLLAILERKLPIITFSWKNVSSNGNVCHSNIRDELEARICYIEAPGILRLAINSRESKVKKFAGC